MRNLLLCLSLLPLIGATAQPSMSYSIDGYQFARIVDRGDPKIMIVDQGAPLTSEETLSIKRCVSTFDRKSTQMSETAFLIHCLRTSGHPAIIALWPVGHVHDASVRGADIVATEIMVLTMPNLRENRQLTSAETDSANAVAQACKDVAMNSDPYFKALLSSASPIVSVPAFEQAIGRVANDINRCAISKGHKEVVTYIPPAYLTNPNLR